MEGWNNPMYQWIFLYSINIDYVEASDQIESLKEKISKQPRGLMDKASDFEWFKSHCLPNNYTLYL